MFFWRQNKQRFFGYNGNIKIIRVNPLSLLEDTFDFNIPNSDSIMSEEMFRICLLSLKHSSLSFEIIQHSETDTSPPVGGAAD